MLVTGLTLIAAGLGRQVSALKILESSQISHCLADRLLVREILRRDQGVEGSLPEAAGFQTSIRTEVVRVPRAPLPDLEMERVIGEVSWEDKGRSRSAHMETGVPKKQEPAP